MYCYTLESGGRIAGVAGEVAGPVLYAHRALTAEHYPVIIDKIYQVCAFIQTHRKVHGLVVAAVQHAYPLDVVYTIWRAAARRYVNATT